MLKCWSYRPEERPTFRYCLDVLLDLKENTSAAIQIVSSSNNRQQNGKFCPQVTAFHIAFHIAIFIKIFFI